MATKDDGAASGRFCVCACFTIACARGCSELCSICAAPHYIVQSVKKPLYIETPDYFNSFNLGDIIASVEQEVIRKAIAEFGALKNVSEHLGIDLSTLVRKKRR